MPEIFKGDFFHLSQTMLEILRDDFLTQVGPSVPEIFKDGFFCPSGTICTWGHLCPGILIGVFVITRVPWVICARDFNGGGPSCARNVRFYLEATIFVERLFCQFPP